MEGREGRWRRMGKTQVLTHTLSLLVHFQSKGLQASVLLYSALHGRLAQGHQRHLHFHQHLGNNPRHQGHKYEAL